MTARWTLYLEKKPYDNGEGGVEKLGSCMRHQAKERQTHSTGLVGQKYGEAIDSYLKIGKKVVVVYSVPEVGWSVPSQLGKRSLFGRAGEGDLTHDYTAYLRRSKDTLQALDSVGERPDLDAYDRRRSSATRRSMSVASRSGRGSRCISMTIIYPERL